MSEEVVDVVSDVVSIQLQGDIVLQPTLHHR